MQEKNISTTERRVGSQEAQEKSYRAMEGLIKELQDVSKYTRAELPNGKELITSKDSGEEFTIKLVENAEDSIVAKMHDFMSREFSEDETETIEWLKHSIEAKLNTYHVVEDKNGEVLALSSIQHLDLKKISEQNSSESIIAVWFIVTDPKMRNRGLASELYQSFYKDSLEDARSEGSAIKGIIGEAVATVESFLNRMGRKRMYFEDARGNVREVPYFCPPINFNSETGAAEGEEVAEHVMLRMLNDAEALRVEEFLPMIAAMYKEYLGKEDDYDSKEAFENARTYLRGMLNELQDTLSKSKDGTLFFLDKEARESKRSELKKSKKKMFEVKTENE